MDEARFVFEFVDRGGNARAPGSTGQTGGSGQSSNTAGGYLAAQGQAGGAGSLAAENARRARGPASGSPTPASVPGTQASKPSDVGISVSDTFNEIGGIVGQAANAIKSLPTSPADVMNRGQAVADTLTRTAALADRMFPSRGGTTAVGAVGAASARAIGTGATAAAGSGAAGGAASAAGLGAAAASIAGPVAYGAALLATPVAVAAYTANRMSEIAGSSAAEYSPEIARALAEAEIRQMRADMRTAQRQGERVADYVEAQSIAKSQMQRIKDSAVGALGDEVNAAADLGNIIASGIAKAFEGQEGINEYWREKLGLNDIYARLNEIAKKLTGDEDANTFFHWFDKQPMPSPPNIDLEEGEVQGTILNAVAGLPAF